MIPHSTRFEQALQHSQVVRTTVDVYKQGVLQYKDMPITEGNLTIDDTSVRTSCTFTCNDPDLTPSDTNELLQPGNDLIPYRGIVFPNGEEELIQLGVLPIAVTRVDDSGDGFNLRIDTFDRAKSISEAKMPRDWWIRNNANLIDTAQALLEFRAPWIETNFPELDFELPRQLVQLGDDPWEFLRGAFATFGYDLFFDRFGVVTCKEVVVDPSDPVRTYTDDELSTMIYLYKELNRDRSYSRIVVTGESASGNPVKAEAMDLDPASPTYIYGPFGDVPYIWNSSSIKTVRQAQLAADRLLVKHSGLTELLQLLIGVDPALELGDLIRVDRAKSQIHADYIISKITIPMIYERGMNLSSRLRRVT